VYEPRDLSGVHVAPPQPQLPSTLERGVQWQWRLVSLLPATQRKRLVANLVFLVATNLVFMCATRIYGCVSKRVSLCTVYLSDVSCSVRFI
jgi:hypothetical protein